MPEPGEHSEPTENKEIPSVTITYSYKDLYHRELFSGTSNNFDVEDPKNFGGATEFEGYIETPCGDFAFEGKIAEAQKLISLIKELTTLIESEAELKEGVSHALDMRESYGPTHKNDSEKYGEFDGEFNDKSRELEKIRFRIVSLKKSLEKYK